MCNSLVEVLSDPADPVGRDMFLKFTNKVCEKTNNHSSKKRKFKDKLKRKAVKRK